MANRKPTMFGAEVKKKLIDLGLSQLEFCKMYNIPPNRFSELLTGYEPSHKYKKLVAEILNIKQIA